MFVDDSRLVQVEVVMFRYNLQIFGLSEVRRNGFGDLRIFGGLILLYLGKESEEEVCEYGVGFLFLNVVRKSFLDWKLILDWIIYV